MRRSLGIGLVGAAAVWFALARYLRDRPPLSLAEQIEVGLRDPSGWWVRLVLDAFRYLESEYGYSLAEVQMHFRGNFIRYRGPVFDFVTEYDPDTRSIGAALWVLADLHREEQGDPITYPRVIDVNRLLRARDPNRLWPERMPPRLDRDVVSRAVVTWAQGLRELAPDVLAGALPADVMITHSG